MQPSAPPGWYADPAYPGSLRWFDGVQWTQHAVTATPSVLPPGYATAPRDDEVLRWVVPVGRTWQSVTAGYVGLVAVFIVFLGPVALGMGIWGLRSVANSYGTTGRGRSIFGIVAGIWGTFWTFAIVLTSG